MSHMTNREETALRQGHTNERVWKEYTVELVLDFKAYEGDELTQAEALVQMMSLEIDGTGLGNVYLKHPGRYPQEV